MNKRGYKARAFAMALLFSLASGAPASAFPFSSDLARFEKAKGHFRQGIHFFNKKQYLGAVEFFRSAVSAYPDYHTAREFLARSYRYAGFADEALREWESLSEMNPDNVYLKNKIDTLRFRKVRGVLEADPLDMVMSAEVVSARLNRYRFPHPVDFTVDADKNLYITSFSLGRITKVDPNGNGIVAHTPSLTGKLFGIDYHNGLLAVTDFSRDLVYLLNTSFRMIKKFGGSGSGDGLFHGPEGVCFDDKGLLYVVDNGNARVQKFSSDGSFILQFGEPGDYDGRLDNPTGVAVLKDRVYVTDTGNARVASFDDSGNFTGNFTVEGLTRPRGITASGNHLLVSDEKAGLLHYDTETGTGRWFDTWNNGERKFSRLYSAMRDRDGSMYCLDYNHERVTMFTPPQARYTNLDLEITSVDTRNYPTVAVYLNVRGRDGRPVYGLTKQNFTITEDGARVKRAGVDYLKEREPSSSMVLCVDRSKSASSYHTEMPWVSEFVLQRMKKNDTLKVMNFNRDFWTGNDFDWSRRRALNAIGKKEYANTSDYGNVLYNALNDLVPKLNRRGIIMITDGAMTPESFTKYSPEYIVEYARSHYIPVFIVTFRDAPEELRKIAHETGGDIMRASEIVRVRTLYESIRNSEEYRYLVMYRSYKLPVFRGWWSDLKISVDYRGLKGVEWGGYFAPQ